MWNDTSFAVDVGSRSKYIANVKNVLMEIKIVEIISHYSGKIYKIIDLNSDKVLIVTGGDIKFIMKWEVSES